MGASWTGFFEQNLFIDGERREETGDLLGVSELLDEKKKALRLIALEFAQGRMEESSYGEKTSALFREIEELKARFEQEEKLKKQYEATYADIVGFPVLLGDKSVGRISGIASLEGKPALLLSGNACPKCHALLEENAKFCVECGARL